MKNRKGIFISNMVLNKSKINKLKKIGRKHPEKRARYCLHKGIDDDDTHIMMIYQSKGNTIDIHSHPDKSSTSVIIEGKMFIEYYDENNNVINRILMEPYDTGNTFICKTPKCTIYTMIPLTDVVYIEFIKGPFDDKS